MAAQEDDSDSEQVLEKILETPYGRMPQASPRTKSYYLATVHIRGFTHTHIQFSRRESVM